MRLDSLYWDDGRETLQDDLERLASLWLDQVDAFDSLPQKRYERRYVKFSPSQADNCLRELFFVNTNAPQDDEPQVAWKNRRRRNGDAYHAETERQHAKMVDKLREAGLDVNFEVVAIEHRDRIRGEAKFNVNGYEVIIEGRPDVILRYVGEAIPGLIETGDYVIVDYKSKDKLSGVNKVVRMGVPAYNAAQMTAYSLLDITTKDGRHFGPIDLAILHYEALQKPNEKEEASKDIHAVVVKATEDEQRRLLVRWASVVEAIEKGEVPSAETDKCYWCAYKSACASVERGEE